MVKNQLSYSGQRSKGDDAMGLLVILVLVALGVIVWLLFRIDAKLQAIGDMLYAANKDDEPKRLSEN